LLKFGASSRTLSSGEAAMYTLPARHEISTALAWFVVLVISVKPVQHVYDRCSRSIFVQLLACLVSQRALRAQFLFSSVEE
jgi:hypothetical protein